MYKVLIAEDKPLIRKGIINMIHWDDLHCSLAGEAENGQDAIRMLRAMQPDILLTDIKMPRIDGMKLLDYIQEQKLTTKVIIISGYDNFEFTRHAIQSRCVDYILKPIHEDELNRAVASACKDLDAELGGIDDRRAVARQRLLSAVQLNREMTFSELFGSRGNDCQFLFGILKNKYNDYPPLQETAVAQLPTNIGLLCVESQEYLNLVFSLPSPKELPVVRGMLTGLPHRLNPYLQTGLSASLSQIHGQTFPVWEACQEARQALCMRLIQPSRYLFEFAGQPDAGISFADITQLEPSILDFLLSGNGPQAFSICLHILDQGLQGGVGIGGYCMYLTQFYYILLKTDTLYAPQIQEEIRRINQPDCLLLLDSIDQLTAALSRFCNLIAGEVISKRNSNSSLAKDVKSYIDTHYMEHLSLGGLSNLFHVNASYLSVLFKKENGIGISRYIRTVRLDYAKQLLAATDYKLADIGEKVGLPNYVHFSKIFKSYTGVSPSEYRRLHGQKE